MQKKFALTFLLLHLPNQRVLRRRKVLQNGAVEDLHVLRKGPVLSSSCAEEPGDGDVEPGLVEHPALRGEIGRVGSVQIVAAAQIYVLHRAD